MPSFPAQFGTWSRECRARAVQLQARCQARAQRLAAGARQAAGRLILLGLGSY